MRKRKILLGLSDTLLGHLNRLAKEDKTPRAVLIRNILQEYVIKKAKNSQRGG